MSLQRAIESAERWAWVAQHCPWTRPGWAVDRGLDRVHRAALRDDRRGVLEWLAAAGHGPRPSVYADRMSLEGLVASLPFNPGARSRRVEFVLGDANPTSWRYADAFATGLSCFEFDTPPWHHAVRVERRWALVCNISASSGDAALLVDGNCRYTTSGTIVPVPVFDMRCIQVAVLHDERPTEPVRLTMTVWELPVAEHQRLGGRASFCRDYDYRYGHQRPIDDLSVTPSRLDRED
jgi:hypothetical protein